MTEIGRTHPDRMRGDWVSEGYVHQPDLDRTGVTGAVETWTAEDGSKIVLGFSEYDVVNRVEYFDPAGAPGRGAEPATILLGPDGEVLYVDYRVHGERHRVDGPAEIHSSATGAVVEEIWLLHGYELRPDGPSRTVYDPDTGAVVSRSWCFEGGRYGFPVKWTSGRHGVMDEYFAAGVELGFDLAALEKIRQSGVVSVEGLRALRDGAPVEWAKAFELGEEESCG